MYKPTFYIVSVFVCHNNKNLQLDAIKVLEEFFITKMTLSMEYLLTFMPS